VWRTKRRDLVFVAGRDRPPYDLGLMLRRIRQEPFRTALAATWRVNSLEGVLAHYLAGPSLRRRLGRDELSNASTDDLNLVEFGFARGVYGAGSIDIEDIRGAVLTSADRFPRIDGPVDAQLVQDDDIAIATNQSLPPDVAPGAPPSRLALAAAQAAWVAGDLATALRRWREVGRPPHNLTEVAMVAEALADTGDEAALPELEKLRPYSAVEADLILGRLRFRRGQMDEATAALEAGFVHHRTDPWPSGTVVRRALTLARQVVKSHPPSGTRLYDAVSLPFAVMVLEEDRRETALSLAWNGPRERCVTAFAAYEPFVPWRQSFLERRRECYVGYHSPLAPRAMADLQAWSSDQPEAPFGP
jgi:spermidine synthase